MKRVWLVTALGAALGLSCSDPTNTPLTQLNLDRPVDIAFACVGSMRVTEGRTTSQTTDPIITTAQPTSVCDVRSRPDAANPDPRPQGQEGPDVFAPSWYGFILQSAPGTVAVATWPSAAASAFVAGGAQATVIDADPLTPGKNAISIGEEPIAIATDKTGCFEVTANAGSCDLSELNINSALDHDTEKQVQVVRVPVKNASGVPILARPAAMVAEPSTTVIGNVCGTTAAGLIYIAYPSCHLVAAVDASTGMMVAGIKYDSTGAHVTDGNQTCPDECTDGLGKPGPRTEGPRPVTLALEVDSRASVSVKAKRLAIGADNLASITVVDLDDSFLPPPASTPLQIALEDPTHTLGITSIALSPVILMGGDDGRLNDDDIGTSGDLAQYVYAVATDNTVRVADVRDFKRECETQVDSRFARALVDGVGADPIFELKSAQCLPIGPESPRRSGAKGPGIELTGNGVPLSVAFFTAATVPIAPAIRVPEGPASLVGHFAIITASNGLSFVVNVDDDNAPDVFEPGSVHSKGVELNPLSTAPAFVLPHQLRDGVASRGVLASTDPAADDGRKLPSCSDVGPNPDSSAPADGPRATSPPVRNAVSLLGDSAATPVVTDKVTELPYIRQLTCVGADKDAHDVPIPFPVSELMFASELSVRDEVFPDIRALTSDERWSLTWEGTLSLDESSAVDGPVIHDSRMRVDGDGLHLLDQAKPFCAIGVEPFDVVQLHGCNPANGNSECPVGYQCYVHPDSLVPIGACMLANEAERLATACRNFLITNRRYTVKTANSGELLLVPRKHELRTTPIDGCTSDLQCTFLANYAAQNLDRSAVVTPVVVPTDPGDGTPLKDVNSRSWACRTDDARAPINADPAKNQRCVETCASDTDCDTGTICEKAGGNPRGVCMEGVTPPQSCVNGPQRFDVRASEAFTVIGARSGYVHPVVERAGTCERDPAASPLQIGRIPLKAPPCGPRDPDPALSTDPITGELPGMPRGRFEPNPCSLTVPQSENRLKYPNIDNPDAPKEEVCLIPDPPTEVVERDAPAIQFRNRGMKMTLVDTYYAGDRTCILDRRGSLGADRIPMVFPGYQLAFRQTAGFSPLALPIAPAFPIKVVHGPTDSIWVIDDGDLLSTQITQASTRGKVYRIESISIGATNLLQ